MKTTMIGMLLVTTLAGMAGCATNPIVGHGATQAGRYTGDVGITGNGTILTIRAGSNVTKLSIVGDACTVTVEDGAVVRRIEFWGAANKVIIPDVLDPIVASMGTNEVVRRPVGQPAMTQPTAPAQPVGK